MKLVKSLVESLREKAKTKKTSEAKEEEDGFHRSAGSWKGLIDAEKLIADIYTSRLVSTRPEVIKLTSPVSRQLNINHPFLAIFLSHKKNKIAAISKCMPIINIGEKFRLLDAETLGNFFGPGVPKTFFGLQVARRLHNLGLYVLSVHRAGTNCRRMDEKEGNL